MNDRPRPEHRTAQPIRGLAQRFVYLGLVLSAFALMMLGKADAVLVERLRAAVTDTVAPVLDVVSQPVDAAARAVAEVRALANLHDDNAALRRDRERLLRWQALARRLETENRALRGLLNFVPGPEARFVTARVIADSGGAFAHSVLINTGDDVGLKKGEAVVTGEGLVGRVAGVASRSSRILLITDLNSRVPVAVGDARTRAILAGDNTERPKLIHMVPDAVVEPGDRVVTSGDAGAFPPGLPVGVVAVVAEGVVGVEPFAQRSGLEYVRIVDYGLAGVIGGRENGDASRPAAPPAPETAPESAAESAAGEDGGGGVEP